MEACILAMKRHIDQSTLQLKIQSLSRDCALLMGLTFRREPGTEEQANKVRKGAGPCHCLCSGVPPRLELRRWSISKFPALLVGRQLLCAACPLNPRALCC